MNLRNPLKIIVSFAKRAGILYILAFVLFHTVVDRDLLKLKVLNHYLPSGGQWAKFVENPERLNRKELEEFAVYYKKVIHYMPQRADAYGMLGFCYTHLGEDDKAISSYKKAIQLEPHFFWPHFNLGVIYFKNGQYKQAVKTLQKAMATSSSHALAFIKLSKMYQDIVGRRRDSDDTIQKRLDGGYRDCFALLVSGYYHLRNFPVMLRTATHVINSSFGNKDAAYYYAGIAAYELKAYERGAFFLQEGIRRNPHNVHALHYLGLCLKALGKEKMSVMILQKAESLPKTENPIRLKEDNIEIRIF